MNRLSAIWKNKAQILEGIKNHLIRNEHVEELASYRSDICGRCPHLDTTGIRCLAPGTHPCCGDCGCSLAFKTRSLSSACPRNYWAAVLSEDEERRLNHY